MKEIDEVIEGHGGWPVRILTLKSKSIGRNKTSIKNW